MTFQTFIETKYPLYSDPQMKVNLTVQQVCELVEEWEKSVSENTQNDLGEQCNHPLDMQMSYHDQSILCRKCKCVISQFGEEINPPHSLI